MLSYFHTCFHPAFLTEGSIETNNKLTSLSNAEAGCTMAQCDVSDAAKARKRGRSYRGALWSL